MLFNELIDLPLLARLAQRDGHTSVPNLLKRLILGKKPNVCYSLTVMRLHRLMSVTARVLFGAAAGTALMGVAGAVSNGWPLYIAAAVFAIAGGVLARSVVREQSQR